MAEQGDFLDGPGFVKWLEETVGKEELSEHRLGSRAKRIRDWRYGGLADVYTVDIALVELDLRLSQVPDELYVTNRRSGGKGRARRKLTENDRAMIQKLAKSGKPQWMIAEQFKVHKSTIGRVVKGRKR